MAYQVRYFAIPALGEPIRLLLHLGKFDFADDKFAFKEWPEIKRSTKWGQVPVLIAPDGTEMTQAKAIVRYLGMQVSSGRRCLIFSDRLYPADSKLAFQVDEMVDALEDVRLRLVPTLHIQDEAEKCAARKALFSPGGEVHDLLKQLERFCGDRHVVGNTLTIADIWFFSFLNFLRCGFLEGIPTDFLAGFPKLAAVVANVGSLPEVRAYYAKKDLEAEPLYSVFVE